MVFARAMDVIWSFEKMKIEIDESIIKETILCQHEFVCLDGDLSCCGKVRESGMNLLCDSRPDNHRGIYCYYKLKMTPINIFCGCLVRKEIFRKFQI